MNATQKTVVVIALLLVSATCLYPNWILIESKVEEDLKINPNYDRSLGQELYIWKPVSSNELVRLEREFLMSPPTKTTDVGHRKYTLKSVSIDVRRMGVEVAAIILPFLALVVAVSGRLGERIADASIHGFAKLRGYLLQNSLRKTDDE